MILNVKETGTDARVCTMPCHSATQIRWDLVLVDGRIIEFANSVEIERIEDEHDTIKQDPFLATERIQSKEVKNV